MRTARRFRPVLDCMQARVAPSAMAVIGPVPPPTTPPPIMVATIGDPTITATGEGSYPILPDPTGPSTGNIC